MVSLGKYKNTRVGETKRFLEWFVADDKFRRLLYKDSRKTALKECFVLISKTSSTGFRILRLVPDPTSEVRRFSPGRLKCFDVPDAIHRRRGSAHWW